MTGTTVIDYIVQRLVDEGVADCFGVPQSPIPTQEARAPELPMSIRSSPIFRMDHSKRRRLERNFR
jgi:hypothetical protein